MTFFTQFFWLFIVFTVFYSVMTNFLLPKISTGLKLRRKNIEMNQQGSESSKDEEVELIAGYENLLGESLGESKRLFAKTLAATSQWLDESMAETNRTAFGEANQEYLLAMAELKARKYILQDCFRAQGGSQGSKGFFGFGG